LSFRQDTTFDQISHKVLFLSAGKGWMDVLTPMVLPRKATGPVLRENMKKKDE